MANQRILILNFGGQYDELIARRVRENNVYSEVKPYSISLEEIKAFNSIGIIFTGGPQSVYKENSPHPDERIFELGIPILGICYGCQQRIILVAKWWKRKAILLVNMVKHSLILTRRVPYSKA